MFTEDLDTFFDDFGETHTIDSASVICIVGEKIRSQTDAADTWNRESAFPSRTGIDASSIESFEITVKKTDVSVYVPKQVLDFDGVSYQVGAFRDDGSVVNIHLSRIIS
jgi:hypothetical protein